jgi:hypothetical protein
MKLDDPIEQIIADALDKTGIEYVHETKSKDVTLGLDFYLPGSGIFIECKQFWSENTGNQTARATNIIVIQGRQSAQFFYAAITAKRT